MANASLKKMRAAPRERQELKQPLSIYDQVSISRREIDPAETIAMAERTRLSLYDASYLWLARALNAELVTLDDRLARAI